MAQFSVKKLNALPAVGSRTASTMYIIPSTTAGFVDIHFTGNDPATLLSSVGIANVNSAVQTAIQNLVLTESQIPNLPGTKITSAVAEATVAGKLKTAVQINGVDFDGSANITVPAEDTATPRVAVSDIGTTVAPLVAGKIPTQYIPNGLDNIDEYPTVGDFPATGSKDVIYIDAANNTMYRWTGSTYVMIPNGGGLADAAIKLQTARTISLSGAATGQVDFDGSQNVDIAVTLGATGIAAGPYAKLTVGIDGRATAGGSLVESDIPNLPGTKITSAVAEATHAVSADTALALDIGTAEW